MSTISSLADDPVSSPDKQHTIRIIVLSGRSGSGKSSTAFEICHLLRLQKTPHTHIDGDNLDAFYPRDDNPQMMLSNLRSMWSVYCPAICSVWNRTNFEDKPFVVVLSGTGLVLELEGIFGVFNSVWDERASHEGIVSVNIDVNPVVLEAGNEVVEARLKVREIGGELDAHLVSSYKMSRVLGALEKRGLKRIRSDGRTVREVACEILRHINVEVRER